MYSRIMFKSQFFICKLLTNNEKPPTSLADYDTALCYQLIFNKHVHVCLKCP